MVKATKTTKSPFSKIFSIEIPELNIEQWWSSFARLVFMGVSWRRIFFLRGGTRFSFSGADWKLRNVFAVYACNFLLYIYAFFLSSCTKIKFCISLYYCAQKRKRKKEKKKHEENHAVPMCWTPQLVRNAQFFVFVTVGLST